MSNPQSGPQPGPWQDRSPSPAPTPPSGAAAGDAVPRPALSENASAEGAGTRDGTYTQLVYGQVPYDRNSSIPPDFDPDRPARPRAVASGGTPSEWWTEGPRPYQGPDPNRGWSGPLPPSQPGAYPVPYGRGGNKGRTSGVAIAVVVGLVVALLLLLGLVASLFGAMVTGAVTGRDMSGGAPDGTTLRQESILSVTGVECSWRNADVSGGEWIGLERVSSCVPDDADDGIALLEFSDADGAAAFRGYVGRGLQGLHGGLDGDGLRLHDGDTAMLGGDDWIVFGPVGDMAALQGAWGGELEELAGSSYGGGGYGYGNYGHDGDGLHA